MTLLGHERLPASALLPGGAGCYLVMPVNLKLLNAKTLSLPVSLDESYQCDPIIFIAID